ncbi:MAG: transporter substrate-binding domain-containing protein [Oscillospiraceae bacterium]|nr:transporter substrate-binding domain-containing protein [Oscillospiraceae bacterium]
MKKFVAIVLSLMLAVGLCACGESKTESGKTYADVPGLEDGILTVGMECAYAPYNWTQMDDSNGAVPIANNPGTYANGYDVMIAKKIAEYYDVTLEVMAIGWDGLNPALDEGKLDAVIAGQSMTEERLEEVEMAGPYFYANIVCVARKDTPQAAATGISNLTGTCTAQTGTVWYNDFIDQIPGATKTSAAETANAMVMAVAESRVDFICTDMPTAMGACATYDNLMILDFSGTDDDFAASEGDINIGISVKLGNTALKDMMDEVLKDMTVEDFNDLMNDAIAVQPEI